MTRGGEHCPASHPIGSGSRLRGPAAEGRLWRYVEDAVQARNPEDALHGHRRGVDEQESVTGTAYLSGSDEGSGAGASKGVTPESPIRTTLACWSTGARGRIWADGAWHAPLFSLYDLFMVSEEQIRTWAEEAEAGYDVGELKRRGRGRPGRGTEPMQVVAVRLTAQELAALDAAAVKHEMSRSGAIRAALDHFAESACPATQLELRPKGFEPLTF